MLRTIIPERAQLRTGSAWMQPTHDDEIAELTEEWRALVNSGGGGEA